VIYVPLQGRLHDRTGSVQEEKEEEEQEEEEEEEEEKEEEEGPVKRPGAIASSTT